MADIFISYSREDRQRVESLAEALVAAGYSVWWDRNLAGGSRYLNETEAELKAAKAVLVVWTKTSVASHWVADEAGAARDSGRLVPISLDASVPPLGFRQFQVIDFSHWRAGEEAMLGELRSALARLVAPGAAPPPAASPSRSVADKRRPFIIIGGIALVAVALVAAITLFAIRSQAASPPNQRTAFFGFSSDAGSPAIVTMARSATDETFKTLNALGLDTVAGSEALGVERNKQLEWAAKKGALYALSGEVRLEGGQFTVSTRLEDVRRGTILWTDARAGGADNQVSLPVQAAARATAVVQCYALVRASLKRETDRVLQAVSRLCAARNVTSLAYTTPARELAALAPDSAYVQADFARNLYLATPTAPASDRPAMRQELDAALKQAIRLDPSNSFARVLKADLAIADGAGPLAEAERLFLDALKDDPDSWLLGIR